MTSQAPDPAATDTYELRLKKLEDLSSEVVKHMAAQERHRTRVETILGIVGASAIVVVVGAFNLRDSVTRLEAGAASRDARIAVLEANASKRDTDDRGTREAIVRLQTTMETLQSTIAHRLDAIDQRLANQPPR